MKKLLLAFILLLLLLPTILASDQLLYHNRGWSTLNNGATNYNYIVANQNGTMTSEMWQVISTTGRFKDFRVELANAPGVGSDWNFILRVSDGVAIRNTDIRCVIADTDTNCHNTTDLAHVIAPGMVADVMVIPTNAPTASEWKWSMVFDSNVETESILPAGTANNTDAVATEYNFVYGSYGWDGTEDERTQLVSSGGIIKDLYVQQKFNSGVMKMYTYTLMKNGVATGLECSTWTTDSCNETGVDVHINQGDRLTLRIVPFGGPATGDVGWGFVFDANVPGESIIPALYVGDLNTTNEKYFDLYYKAFDGASALVDLADEWKVQGMATNGFFKNFTMRLSGSPGVGKDYSFILRNSGADGSLGCSVADNDTTCQDNTTKDYYDAWDSVNIKITPSGTPTARSMKYSTTWMPTYNITINNYTTGTATDIPTAITIDCNGTDFDANYQSPKVIRFDYGKWKCDFSADGWDTNTGIIIDATEDDDTITIYQDQLYDADFTNPAPGDLDPENGTKWVVVSFTDNTTYAGLTGTAWEWKDGGVQFALTQNADQNFTTAGDYNICIDVDADDWNGTSVRDVECKTILIKQYPQNVGFTPTAGVFGTAVSFTGSADGNITDWHWDFGGDGTSAIQNPSHDFSAPGDYNVCLKATAWNDLNRQLCQNVRIFGNLSIIFVDETTHTPLQPQVFINDVNYTSLVSPAGELDVNMDVFFGTTITMRAYDDSRSERTWFWDFNQFTAIDINASLLETIKGMTIDFVFHNASDVKIPNTIIEVHRTSWPSNGQMASRKKTNASAETSFFLNPTDCNYVFTINPGASSYDYSSVSVIVNRPKDEETSEDINGFDVSVGNLTSFEFEDQNFPVEFCIYGNTEGYYYITINHDDYDARDYTARVLGDTSTYTINPWLAKSASGSDIVFITRNQSTLQNLPDILIQVWKYIEGSGNQLIESAQTDMVGSVSMNFILGDNYSVAMYWENESHVWNLVYSGTFIPISTDVVYHELQLTDYNWATTQTQKPIVKFYPATGFAYHSSPFDLNQVIIGDGITDVKVKIGNVGTIIWLHHYGPVASGTNLHQLINPALLQPGFPVKVMVRVFTDSNTEHVDYTMSYQPWDSSEDNILTLLAEGVPHDLSCPTDGSPCITLVLFVIAVVILVLGWMAQQGALNYTPVSAVMCIILGFFAYIGWIPVVWFLLVVFICIISYFAFRRDGLG